MIKRLSPPKTSLSSLFTSPLEEELLKLAYSYNQDQELVHLITQQFKPESLITLGEKYPSLEKELKRDSLRKYWLEAYATMAAIQEYPNGKQYQHDPHRHPFDEVKGLSYFVKVLNARRERKSSIEYKDDSEKELTWLKKADAAGCYDAARELHFINIQKLQDDTAEFKIEDMMDHAEKTAEAHLTPGNILAAEYYNEIAEYYAKKDNQKERERFLMLTMLHLILAKELESYSAISIHNAYYGENLTNAFEKHYATVIKAVPFVSWDTFITQIQKHFHLEKRIYDTVEEMAIKIANDKKKSLKL